MSSKIRLMKKLSNFNLDVSFELDGNIGIMGSSGSGKTTILKCIADITEDYSGYIEIDGKVLFDSDKEIHLPTKDRDIGYLPAGYGLFNNMSVKDNIVIGLKSHGHDNETIEVKLKEITQLFSISHLLDRYPYHLSSGEKQRVAFSRMLVYKPSILLMDEPFSAIDSDLKQQIMPQLKQIIDSYHPVVIMVSHNKEELDYFSDHLLRIKEGQLV